MPCTRTGLPLRSIPAGDANVSFTMSNERLQMFDDILICPQTGHRITIDAVRSIAKVEESHLSYPIKDGIIDFLPDTVDRISKS